MAALKAVLKTLEMQLQEMKLRQVAPDPTDVITINFDPGVSKGKVNSFEDFKNLLLGGLPGKLYLTYSHPPAPTTDAMVESLRFQLEQIRLNQLRLQ